MSECIIFFDIASRESSFFFGAAWRVRQQQNANKTHSFNVDRAPREGGEERGGNTSWNEDETEQNAEWKVLSCSLFFLIWLLRIIFEFYCSAAWLFLGYLLCAVLLSNTKVPHTQAKLIQHDCTKGSWFGMVVSESERNCVSIKLDIKAA